MNNSYNDTNYDSTLEALMGFLNTIPQSTIKALHIPRYKLMLQSASQLTALLKETMSQGEITIDVDQTFNLGSISVELDTLTIYEPKIFADIICNADNFEIYPLTNGKIRLEFTFQSILKSIL